MRYIGRVYKGRNGEVLYPGPQNATLNWEIDDVMEMCEEMVPKIVGFLVPFIP